MIFGYGYISIVAKCIFCTLCDRNLEYGIKLLDDKTNILGIVTTT